MKEDIKKEANAKPTKRRPGQPGKLKNFIEAFKKVLEKSEFDVVILTDDELRMACNELLEPKQQIADITFETRKMGRLKDSTEYQEFVSLYKKALANQKRELFKKFQGDPQRQRYAWILERKFADWNLKVISENKNLNENSGEIVFKIKQ